jgi:hypothetical protein
MATTTPNYGWVVPTSTDLVKDGATAIETLGDSADATVKALNPETTLGDIAYRSATANTNTRLAIGSTGNILTVVGGVPAWSAPAGGGKVLQVVQSTTSTGVVISNTSFVDTGLSGTITPSSASSKILVLVTQKYFIYTSTAPVSAAYRLMRGATSINDFLNGSASLYAAPTSATLYLGDIWNLSYLDSPATTSATTYKTQANVDNTGSSRQVELQPQNSTSTMILMEIGA